MKKHPQRKQQQRHPNVHLCFSSTVWMELITVLELVPKDEQGTKAQRDWSVVCARVQQTAQTQNGI